MKKLILFLLMAGFAMPVLYLGLLSVSGSWVFPALWPGSFSMTAWATVLGGANGFSSSLFLSIMLSASVALACTLSGFFLGRTVAYHANGIRLQAIAWLPYAFSPVIYAYCLQFYFLKADLSGSLIGVWIAQYLLLLPFNVLFFSSHWDERLHAFEQLAQTLGSGNADTWIKVLIPLSKRALINSFVQSFLLSWFDYGLTTVIGLGAVPTLTLKVWQYIGEANPYMAATGSAVLVFIPAFLFLFFRSLRTRKPVV